MKNLKMRRIFAFGIVLFSISFAMSSCSKDSEVTPDYVGTWVAFTIIDDDTEAKETLTFTSNSFNNQFQIKGATTGTWIDYFAMKGSISVNKQLITGTITEIGLAVDLMTGEPTATMTFYKAGSAYFELYLEDAEATFNSEYSVSGNTLTLKTDDNNDGDYLDEDESLTFTKQ